MRAETAGRLISKFISKDFNSNKSLVYEVLTLAINKAWKEGKWFGMTKEIFVPIRTNAYGDRFIIAPTEYPVLLAINVDGQPNVDIRSKNFVFHRNGNGDIKDRCGCKWNKDVFDIGEVPIFDDSKININCPVRIGVRSIGTPGQNEKIFLKGKYADGTTVFTYKQKEFGNACQCSANVDDIETVNGIEIPVNSDFNYISNIRFTEIISIEKTVTRTPVEIIAIREDSSAFTIARLNPGQTKSRYRKYMIPKSQCGYDCIHGLFKISKQEEISSDSDEVIIDDPEILISLAMSIDNLYYKGDTEKGAGYFLQAISMLDKQKREEESPEVFPIQIEMHGVNEKDSDILNYI